MTRSKSLLELTRTTGAVSRIAFAVVVFGACMDGGADLGRGTAGLEIPFELPDDAILPTQYAGALPGALTVNADGAATYELPSRSRRLRGHATGAQPLIS